MNQREPPKTQQNATKKTSYEKDNRAGELPQSLKAPSTSGLAKVRGPFLIQSYPQIPRTRQFKKHGIKASLGAISCLLDPKFLGATSATVAASALAGGRSWAALAGASLTVGQALISFGSALVDGLDQRRKEHYEIAYIYEVRKQLGG